jgi:hypothetical protein
MSTEATEPIIDYELRQIYVSFYIYIYILFSFTSSELIIIMISRLQNPLKKKVYKLH